MGGGQAQHHKNSFRRQSVKFMMVRNVSSSLLLYRQLFIDTSISVTRKFACFASKRMETRIKDLTAVVCPHLGNLART